MNETLYYMRKDELASGLSDLDDVVLTADAVADGGHIIKSGTEGTVVGVWSGGTAYEVEFAEPEGTLATVPAASLRRVTRTPS